MIRTSLKTTSLSFVMHKETKILLEKLAHIHDRSMTGVVEQLIKKEAKECGILDK